MTDIATTTQVQKLCAQIRHAAAAERRAKAARWEAEKALADLLPAPKTGEGTVTEELDGFKITVNHKMARKLDYEAYLAMSPQAGEEFVTLKPSIDTRALRAVERTNPAFVAACVTATPAKVSVKIQEV